MQQCISQMSATTTRDPKVLSPVWLFQFWLQVHFPNFLSILITYSATHNMTLNQILLKSDFKGHKTEECFSYLYTLKKMSEGQFTRLACIYVTTTVASPTCYINTSEEIEARLKRAKDQTYALFQLGAKY